MMKRLLAVIALTSLFTACASVEKASLPVTAKALQHHNWELTHIDGRTLTYSGTAQKPRLEIGENLTANGMAGCNNFFGQAELSDNGEIRIAQMGLTRKMCPVSEMDIELAMVETLSSWSKITLKPGHLILKSKTRELTFKLRDWVN